MKRIKHKKRNSSLAGPRYNVDDVVVTRPRKGNNRTDSIFYYSKSTSDYLDLVKTKYLWMKSMNFTVK